MLESHTYHFLRTINLAVVLDFLSHMLSAKTRNDEKAVIFVYTRLCCWAMPILYVLPGFILLSYTLRLAPFHVTHYPLVATNESAWDSNHHPALLAWCSSFLCFLFLLAVSFTALKIRWLIPLPGWILRTYMKGKKRLFLLLYHTHETPSRSIIASHLCPYVLQIMTMLSIQR